MPEQSFKELAKRTLKLLDFSREVTAVNVDDGSAPAGELLVRLQPSDRLERLFSAVLARDTNILTVEHNKLLLNKKNAPPLQTELFRRRVKQVALLILAGVGVFVKFFIFLSKHGQGVR